MPAELKDVKIRFLALTKRGANKVRSSIFKSEDRMSKIFKEESEEKDSPELMTVLQEVGEVNAQLKKGEVDLESAGDLFDEILIKHGGDALVEKVKAEKSAPVSKDELFKRFLKNGKE